MCWLHLHNKNADVCNIFLDLSESVKIKISFEKKMIFFLLCFCSKH